VHSARVLPKSFSARAKHRSRWQILCAPCCEKKTRAHNILVTRADKKIFAAVKRASGKEARNAKFHELWRRISIERNPEITGKGTILVVSAGTSDISRRGRSPAHRAHDGQPRRASLRRRRRRHSPPARTPRKIERMARVIICVRRNGRRASQRRRRPSLATGHRRAHQRRLWRQLRRRRRAPRHAQFLRLQRHRRQH